MYQYVSKSVLYEKNLFSLKFPSVTICNQNRINCVLFEEGLKVSKCILKSEKRKFNATSVFLCNTTELHQ